MAASDIKKYKKTVTVGDAAVIISKAEEMLYGEIEAADIKFVIENRIADIGKVKTAVGKNALAKAYISGYLEGKSPKPYSHLRLLEPKKKLDAKSAALIVTRLFNREKRVKLSDIMIPVLTGSRKASLRKEKALERIRFRKGWNVQTFPLYTLARSRSLML